MEDISSRLKLRKVELKQLGLLSPEAESLLNDMMEQLERVEQQNAAFRKSLRSSMKTPRMSSKLKDALYE